MSVLLLNSSVFPSERRLVKEIRINVIYRGFLHMALTENRIRPHSARRPALGGSSDLFSAAISAAPVSAPLLSDPVPAPAGCKCAH